MRSTHHQNESKRTSPLALWRYAHDYLRAAQTLSRQHKIACHESQAPYHVACDGLNFAIKAFLRTRGATMTELDRIIGCSLTEALIRSEAQGLPAIPARWRMEVAEIAACCQEHEFVYMATTDSTFIDVEPLVEAGVWILDRIAPDVAEHYAEHLAGDASPSAAEFVGRLRADLKATAEVAVG